MESAVRHLPKSQVELTLSLTAKEVDEYFDKVYRELADVGRIRGFRPGKAPRSIIRRFYGIDQIKGTVWMELVQESMPKALEQHPELRVIGDPVLPDLEEIPLEEGAPVNLSVVVTVYPSATIGDLTDVKLLRPSTEVLDEDVDKILEELRAEHATWAEVTRAIAPGDRVTADVRIFVEDEEQTSQEGLVFEAQPREEGEPVRLPNGVLGHFAGQEVVVEEQIPEDDDSDLAGRTLRYVAKILEVKERQLPEVNDEFAAKVGDFSSVDELREEIRRRLAQESEDQARESLETQAIAYLLANSDIELPEMLIANATQAELEELDSRLEAAGSSLDELVEAGTIDRERMESSQRRRAILGLEARICLEALIESQGLETEEQDVRAEIEKLARETGNAVSFIEQAYEVQEEISQRIDERAKTRRALRWIIEKAEVEEVPRDQFKERYHELLDKLEARRSERRDAKTATEAEAEGVKSETPVEDETKAEAGVEAQAETPEPEVVADSSLEKSEGEPVLPKAESVDEDEATTQ